MTVEEILNQIIYWEEHEDEIRIHVMENGDIEASQWEGRFYVTGKTLEEAIRNYYEEWKRRNPDNWRLER